MSRILHVLIAALAIFATATAADAAKRRAGSVAPSVDETILVGIHDLSREGNKVCMVGHFHSGSSTGQGTKKSAEVAAMRQWALFTGMEYGGSWGNPALAANKSMKCSGAPGNFACDFEGRPCRH